MKSKTQKIEELRKLKDKLPGSKITVFTSFSRTGEKGLSVGQMIELKRFLKTVKSEYFVTKKTLMNLAFKDKKYDGLDIYSMDGSVGIVLGGDDPYVVAKKVYEFSKKNPSLHFWGAIMGSKFLGKESELMKIFYQYGTQIRLRLRRIEDILENQLKIFSEHSSVELFQNKERIIKQLQEESTFIKETNLFIKNNLEKLKFETEKWILDFEKNIPNLERELTKLPRYYRSENIGARHKIGDIVDFKARQHFINSVDKGAVFLSEKPSGYYVPWHHGDLYATTYEIYGNLKILSKEFDNLHLECYEYQAKPFKVMVVFKEIPITLDKMGTPVKSILYKCRVIEE